MIVGDPEELYRQFTRHVAACGVCRAAEGERAAEGDLCAAGRALLHAWGHAEQAYAELAYTRDHVGPNA